MRAILTIRLRVRSLLTASRVEAELDDWIESDRQAATARRSSLHLAGLGRHYIGFSARIGQRLHWFGQLDLLEAVRHERADLLA